jgi:hypothetical protein
MGVHCFFRITIFGFKNFLKIFASCIIFVGTVVFRKADGERNFLDFFSKKISFVEKKDNRSLFEPARIANLSRKEEKGKKEGWKKRRRKKKETKLHQRD